MGIYRCAMECRESSRLSQVKKSGSNKMSLRQVLEAHPLQAQVESLQAKEPELEDLEAGFKQSSRRFLLGRGAGNGGVCARQEGGSPEFEPRVVKRNRRALRRVPSGKPSAEMRRPLVCAVKVAGS